MVQQYYKTASVLHVDSKGTLRGHFQTIFSKINIIMMLGGGGGGGGGEGVRAMTLILA